MKIHEHLNAANGTNNEQTYDYILYNYDEPFPSGVGFPYWYSMRTLRRKPGLVVPSFRDKFSLFKHICSMFPYFHHPFSCLMYPF
jgi:hypothetical protein